MQSWYSHGLHMDSYRIPRSVTSAQSGPCRKSLQVKTWLRFSYWNLYFSRTICPISFVFKIILPFIFGLRMTKTFWLIWMHGAFRRMCISSKIWRLILNMLIRRRRRARMGKLVGVCYSHFSFSSPLSSYLLILSLDLIHSQVPDCFMDYY